MDKAVHRSWKSLESLFSIEIGNVNSRIFPISRIYGQFPDMFGAFLAVKAEQMFGEAKCSKILWFLQGENV